MITYLAADLLNVEKWWSSWEGREGQCKEAVEAVVGLEDGYRKRMLRPRPTPPPSEEASPIFAAEVKFAKIDRTANYACL